MRQLRDEYAGTGLISDVRSLADPSLTTRLLEDLPIFDAAMAQIQKEQRAGVPYLWTPATRAAAQDPALLAIVSQILGTQDLVAWGANIRMATPNDAYRWHVDLESSLWPTITAAIGVDRCLPASSTWLLPGSHNIPVPPPPREGSPEDLRAVLDAARQLCPSVGNPRQVAGFGNAKFYLFNAKLWHRGDPSSSQGRVVLFLHYQAAKDRRIPEMLDHQQQLWSDRPAPFFQCSGTGPVNHELHKLPWRHKVERWKRRYRAWRG